MDFNAPDFWVNLRNLLKKLIRLGYKYSKRKDGREISVQTRSITTKDSKKVMVGLIQTSVSENVADNMMKAAQKIEEAAVRGAQIVCLQELYRTRYFPQEENVDANSLAETVPGESTRAFSVLAKKYKIVLIAPIFEKNSNGKYYNSAVVIDVDGEVLGTYRKTHVPYDPYFYEKDYFDEAGPNYQVFKTAYAQISVLICYDQWFPEAARICCLKGAEIIFYPTAIGYIAGHTSQDGNWHDAWRTVQRAHAIANGVHVAAVNRVGFEGELEFWGGSFICDSFGEVVAEAGVREEEVLVASVDLAKNKRIQDGWGFLRNRRPDTYSAIVKDKTGGTSP